MPSDLKESVPFISELIICKPRTSTNKRTHGGEEDIGREWGMFPLGPVIRRK